MNEAERRIRAAFGAAMARLGLFEDRPHLAVACSGGADSTALALLLQDWTREREGKITALIVDHGLRQDSAAEARQTSERLSCHGIDSVTLVWPGAKPASAIQSEARQARYRLLADWCRKAGVLHLALAHHRLDQSETLLLRQAARSGPAGLSAMPLERFLPDLRLLRPLLDCDPDDLKTLLIARGLEWVEDPSNRDRRFTRVRLRQELAEAPFGRVEELSAEARSRGLERDRTERNLAAGLARYCQAMPGGWTAFERDALRLLPTGLAAAMLARVLTSTGGSDYPPRGRSLSGLMARLRGKDNFRATLGGCLLQAGEARISVFRETALCENRVLESGRHLWDGRFLIELEGGPLRAAALGEPGWKAIARQVEPGALQDLPYPARLAAPGLWDEAGLVAAPLLGWRRKGARAAAVVRFRPKIPLALAGFTVVPAQRHII